MMVPSVNQSFQNMPLRMTDEQQSEGWSETVLQMVSVES